MISVTEINRGFFFLTERYYGLSNSENTAFKRSYLKWIKFGRCFFLSGTWRSGSQQALIKEDEDPYLDGI